MEWGEYRLVTLAQTFGWLGKPLIRPLLADGDLAHARCVPWGGAVQ